jgi:hypothetical protein
MLINQPISRSNIEYNTTQTIGVKINEDNMDRFLISLKDLFFKNLFNKDLVMKKIGSPKINKSSMSSKKPMPMNI